MSGAGIDLEVEIYSTKLANETKFLWHFFPVSSH
jgi:hypothetical protein